MRTIPHKESLTVEFKSDRQRLPDAELIAAIVCLANTEGGHLYLGVEDDGTITGLHAKHQSVAQLSAFIANRTSPPVSVRATVIHVAGHNVAAIEVPKSSRIVATSDGLLQRRRIQADGTPQCVPFYPHEFASRQSDLGLLDYSASPIPEATPTDIDPIERERLRRMISLYKGDSSLLDLSDDELDGALGLVRTIDGIKIPTLTGLLLIGKESAIRNRIPTHEVAFQALENTQVRTNDFYRTPLLRTFERLMEQFEVRIEEEELQWGLFRVPIPTYDRRAFREALVNALIHRDYSQLGTVFIRLQNDTLSISNPGGFVEGVTLENLLVVEPKPRNPTLADAVKRIGIAERTGRGVDLIFQGVLRYGRPEPDYSSTDATTVKVIISSAHADIPFFKMIIEEETQTGRPIALDALILLSHLRTERRIDIATAAQAIQKNESVARSILERLVEAGLVEPQGIKRGRTYTLSASIYRQLGQSADYIRQVGFDRIQQEQMVIQYIQENGQVKRQDVMDLCRLSPDQASRLLKHMIAAKKLTAHGESRGRYYTQESRGKTRDLF
jgi:ATP-dependent DNA helicase RecG